jgi:DNA replication protein DnaC
VDASKFYKSWGIPPGISDNLTGKIDQPPETLSKCKDWLEEDTAHCILSGSNGTGKTTLACRMMVQWMQHNMAKERDRSLSALFVKQTQLYLQWLDEMRTGSVYGLLQRFGEYDILVIDDLGVKMPTEGWREWVTSLIDHRVDWKKRTIITTNCNGDAIQDYYGEAMLSRLLMGTQLKLEGKDRRLQ